MIYYLIFNNLNYSESRWIHKDINSLKRLPLMLPMQGQQDRHRMTPRWVVVEERGTPTRTCLTWSSSSCRGMPMYHRSPHRPSVTAYVRFLEIEMIDTRCQTKKVQNEITYYHKKSTQRSKSFSFIMPMGIFHVNVPYVYIS